MTEWWYQILHVFLLKLLLGTPWNPLMDPWWSSDPRLRTTVVMNVRLRHSETSTPHCIPYFGLILKCNTSILELATLAIFKFKVGGGTFWLISVILGQNDYLNVFPLIPQYLLSILMYNTCVFCKIYQVYGSLCLVSITEVHAFFL